jgi:hypothetical protein
LLCFAALRSVSHLTILAALQALEHAVKIWQANIITLSFGSRKLITVIEKAIRLFSECDHVRSNVQ